MTHQLGRFGRLVAATAAIALAPVLAAAQDYTFRLAHVTSDKEPLHQAMQEFVKNVEERTEGRVAIEIFANAQLGSNPEVFEQVRAGAPIITISDPGYLSDFVADFGVLGGPYLMEDPRDFQKIVDSDLYAGLKDQLRNESGLELLSLNWLFGSRHMLSDKMISSPADTAGMTFRTPPNIMWVETFNAMGARPTQVAWGEVYSALSAGVVEGAEAPLPSIYGAKLHETKKVISLTGHFKGFTGLMMNSDVFGAMPQDIQDIINDEAVKAGGFMTDLMLGSEEEWIAKLEAEGVTFNRDVDIAAFQAATADVYTKFPDWSEGLYDQVRAILDN
ncbi:C4-dicarboxylate TRAP transporter substrate-binding protein [Cognatishimia maritima]|uniref:Tripartite ATP-independent transporter solute receptor, DctP family n=1 Tax=Cognatishimia maritima TaxID=870908 RepID=A0A1M5QIW6_9RHOB|nr:C4-dicarboxylate TRAP transporter substrate-binding protein [Cognatishimia maritima]SHH13868.1 tripartite ATP-independent transporter solute receptor, DctP family [Cognatishimia maritima]